MHAFANIDLFLFLIFFFHHLLFTSPCVGLKYLTIWQGILCENIGFWRRHSRSVGELLNSQCKMPNLHHSQDCYCYITLFILTYFIKPFSRHGLIVASRHKTSTTCGIPMRSVQGVREVGPVDERNIHRVCLSRIGAVLFLFKYNVMLRYCHVNINNKPWQVQHQISYFVFYRANIREKKRDGKKKKFVLS